ncbi:NADP-dependent oxidoreductase [Nocardioides mangrovicus]|uniref:NADP-dependent oxidoreductase n=1 Tax=Nocardioides mangrovicus TaxID=2478913 RepID=A0A3L8P5F1_9ACTN|nr:NADP-dependent oxidoreductase [Nocardioides mangrovicus]RLV50364.1 NADP-dependent oxidoreductase [Nocardioides mangrovicus]
MRAVRFHEYGGPEVLRLEEVDLPVPAAGQVRVRVAATSFNGVDANIRAGLMQGPMPMDLPHVPGLDVAGTVDEVGAGVSGLAVGDEVIGFLPFGADGAAAEYTLAAADTLVAAPTSIPLTEAAALPLVGLTAWQALDEHAGLRAGQRILVNGADGAVGGYAVQLAKHLGARVVATATPRTRAQVGAHGADEVVDRTEGDVAAQLGEPVDVLLNLAPITPEEFAALAARVVDGGVVVSTTVWMPAPGDEARGVRGIDLFVRSDSAQLRDLVALVDRGELSVDVADYVSIEELADLHTRAAAGGVHGKVVVVPTPQG